jgi:GT2 family glycosyltransferase
MKRTLIAIPHYGTDLLLSDLFQSIGFVFPTNLLQGGLALIEQPSYSFLIVNNNIENRGFTSACNVGLSRLKESASDFRYVWLLNNDTAFASRRQFEHALVFMQSLSENRDWAIVAQQVRHFSRRDEIVFGGSLECFPAGRHKSGLASLGDWSVPSEERWVTFCSVLIRRELVENIGLMDGSMVTYYSDSDYCLMARRAGFKVGYAGSDSYLFHKIGQSANPDEMQLRVLRQDLQTFWRKWIDGAGHSLYLKLMSGPGDMRRWSAGELHRQAGAFRELKAWLDLLPPDQKLGYRDILDHFQHKIPTTDFSILCNLWAELDPWN